MAPLARAWLSRGLPRLAAAHARFTSSSSAPAAASSSSPSLWPERRVPCWLVDATAAGPVPYPRALAWQRELLRRRTEAPSAGAERPADPSAAPFPNVVFVLEHPHVYTLGRGAGLEHLRFTPEGGKIRSVYGPEAAPTLPATTASRGSAPAAPPAAVYRVERGGKVTYHGPGQLVVYPVLDLHAFKKDLHWYVSAIEDAVIGALSDFGVAAHRAPGFPGVWVGPRKIAQVGMSVSRWYSSHGYAINGDPDLTFFQNIVPCGIADREVTSLAQELQRLQDSGSSVWTGPASGPALVAALKERVLARFEAVFGAALLQPPGPVSAILARSSSSNSDGSEEEDAASAVALADALDASVPTLP